MVAVGAGSMFVVLVGIPSPRADVERLGAAGGRLTRPRNRIVGWCYVNARGVWVD